jgi:hypothetical protein
MYGGENVSLVSMGAEWSVALAQTQERGAPSAPAKKITKRKMLIPKKMS